MTFGETLKLYREEKGLSQVALAKQLGITSSYISMVEASQRGAFANELLACLAPVLDLPVEYLRFRAGRWPNEDYHDDIDPTEFLSLFTSLTQKLEGKKDLKSLAF